MRLILSMLLLLLLVSGCGIKNSPIKAEYEPAKRIDTTIESDSSCDSNALHDNDYKTILTE